MRCALPTVLGLLTLAAPLASQAKPGHVYGISYYQALPGKAAAYNKALTDVVLRVLDEMVKRKPLVSYLSLNQVAGSGEYSHASLLEFSIGRRSAPTRPSGTKPRRLCTTKRGPKRLPGSPTCAEPFAARHTNR